MLRSLTPDLPVCSLSLLLSRETSQSQLGFREIENLHIHFLFMLCCTLDTLCGCQPPTDRANRKEWIGLCYDDMIRSHQNVIHWFLTTITKSLRLCQDLNMLCVVSSKRVTHCRDIHPSFSTFSLISVMIVYVELIRILECDLRKWEGSLKDRHNRQQTRCMRESCSVLCQLSHLLWEYRSSGSVSYHSYYQFIIRW